MLLWSLIVVTRYELINCKDNLASMNPSVKDIYKTKTIIQTFGLDDTILLSIFNVTRNFLYN